MRKLILGLSAAAAVATCGTSAQAATALGNMNITLTINKECTVVSADTMTFGPAGLLIAALPATADIHVQCTDTTTYNVGLDKGLNGGTVSTRQMLGTLNAPFASVNYGLYQEVGHTTNWGETVGVDTKAGTGNGTTQDITVFGLVPVQTSVKPDTYTDTVAITVTY